MTSAPPPLAAISRLIALHLWLYGLLALAILAMPPLLAIALPVGPMLSVIALRMMLVLLTAWRVRRLGASESETASADGLASAIALSLLADIVALGVLLFLSGGVTNPAISLLLLPIILAAPTLPPRWVASITLLATATYLFLMLHFVPLAVDNAERAMRLHLIGMGITFAVSAWIIAGFVVRMTGAIREREAALAQAREAALRNERLAALGALAAGAAHQLGTPLATMAVTVGELSHDPKLPASMQPELALLQREIGRCKEILSTLTHRVGATRLEGARPVDAKAWLTERIAHWRQKQSDAVPVALTLASPHPLPLIVDGALEQALDNLLDNAVQAGATHIDVRLARQGDEIWVSLDDDGPGFSAAVLEAAGRAPLVAGARGLGLGLFLARAAIERLGGRLQLGNNAWGGGRVEFWLPALSTPQENG